MPDIIEGLERDERAMERLAFATERIADALECWVKLEHQKFDKQFPPEKVKREAEIIRADERKEQFSDKADDKWLQETAGAAGASRFEERFKTEHPGAQPDAQKRRRIAALPQGVGDKTRTN